MQNRFYNHFAHRWLLLACLAALLSACGSSEERTNQAIAQELTAAKASLEHLGKALQDDAIPNASKLTSYATALKQQKPQVRELVDEIAKDATPKGPLYTSLGSRLQQVEKTPEAFATASERLDEVQNIRQAASVTLFNDALSDSVNVLADMSDGTLPRIAAVSKAAEIKANNAKDYGPGSQYIGNPNYGSWQTGSNGMSFWEWYGMYSMFSNLTRPVYFNDWSNHRGYSYYSDYGRSRYTSPSQYSSQEATYTRTKKSFSDQGRNFTSPYASTKTGSSSLSLASKTPSRYSSSYSSGKSSSSYSSSRSNSSSSSYSSSYSSSSRSGSSRTSRSFSGGK